MPTNPRIVESLLAAERQTRLRPRRCSRYCEMCDKWVPSRETECKACGMPTIKAAHGGESAEEAPDGR